MVKKLAERRVVFADEVKVNKLATPAAPPVTAASRGSLTCSLTLLRNIHAALVAGASEARTPHVKNQLMDAVNGLLARMGPAVNPDWKPDGNGIVRRRAKGFRIVNADGTEQAVATLATAARLVGLAPASLAVGLSRGGGRWARKVGDSAVTVTRILA